jgi:hypothetical protein
MTEGVPLLTWPWKLPRRQLYIRLAIFAAVVRAFVAVALQRADEDDPGGTTELCDMLADPRNARLTTGDIRRLADFSQSELESYVAGRCPEHVLRVSD